MAYFEYDDRYGCRVSSDNYVAPKTTDQLKAERQELINSVLADNAVVMGFSTEKMLGAKVSIASSGNPFPDTCSGIEIRFRDAISDTGWSKPHVFWASISDTEYDVPEITMTKTDFWSCHDALKAQAEGVKPQPVVVDSSYEVEKKAIKDGYELFSSEWAEKNPNTAEPQKIRHFMHRKKGERVQARFMAAVNEILRDIEDCKADGSYQATKEWYADLFWGYA